MHQSINLATWRHYFIDLPRWAHGLAGEGTLARMQAFHQGDLAPTRHALEWLWGGQGSAQRLDAACHQALRVKIEREADAFRALRSNAPLITIDGLPFLTEVRREKRATVLLTGHFGSFYTIAVALARAGIPVHPVARTVDTSAGNPRPRQLFERFNYWSTGRRISGHYLYTDFAGWMNKRVISVCKQGGVILVLPDLPRRLFGTGRQPVTLFDRPATLPGRLFELGHKHRASFLPIWSHVDLERRGHNIVTIEPPLPTDSVAATLQGYADSLTRTVRAAPWQWMALPIIEQYQEPTP